MGPQEQYFTGLPPWAELAWAERGKAEENRERIWREIETHNPRVAAYRNLTIRAVSSDKVAKESYFRLLRAGVSQPELLELLVGIAVSLPRRARVPKWWLSGLGMTADQLDYFPKRVEAMAREIERINSHPGFKPDTWIEIEARGLSEGGKRHFGLWFTRLPLLLRHYAAFLRGHSKNVRRFVHQGNREGPQATVLFHLINLVRGETGRPMLDDLSNILMATAAVAGTAQVFDPPSLKVLDSRKRKKRKVTAAH